MGWKIEVDEKGLVSVYSTVIDEWIYRDRYILVLPDV